MPNDFLIITNDYKLDIVSKQAESLEFFVLRNQEGKWFHAKGYGGYGETWVEDIKNARIYNKIGKARAQVTYFYNNWPKYGVPDIIKFSIGSIEVINEESRLKKLKDKKDKLIQKHQILAKQKEIERAKIKIEEATKRLKELENGN